MENEGVRKKSSIKKDVPIGNYSGLCKSTE